MAEAVYTEGMAIPDDSDDLEEEKTMWVTRWEHILVCGGVIRIGDKTDATYQTERESCLSGTALHTSSARHVSSAHCSSASCRAVASSCQWMYIRLASCILMPHGLRCVPPRHVPLPS